jgi:lysophospholipase L1-like esterase
MERIMSRTDRPGLRLGLALAMLVAFLGEPASALVAVAADNPLIRYQGRFDFSQPKRPRCDWPGTAIEARFTGKSIAVKLNGGNDDFNVIVDGVWKAKLGVSAAWQTAASGLSEGAHTLLLTKRTEAFYGIVEFEGFQLEDGDALMALPPRPARKIQFIGDSFTVGYGDESKILSCPERRPFDNNFLAYGPVAARAVGAEYSVQAISGIGMVHNYGDTSPISAYPLGSYFENTLMGASAPAPKWDFSAWIPDLVVIALGTNDFSTTVKPSEAQYAGGYQEFLRKIRTWYPQAVILCLTYAVDGFQGKYVDTLVNQVSRLGDAKLYHAHMPPLDANSELGCDYHPNVAGQQKYADALIPVIRQYLGATSIRPSAPGPKPFQHPLRKRRHAKPVPGETGMIPFADLSGTLATDASGRQLAW